MTLAQQQRDLARERILHAARRVLAQRGLAATVDDVAGVAGVSRRTVFRHFATRDALLATAIRAGVHRYAEHLPAAPEHGDLAGWLAETLLVTHRLNAQNGRVYWELTLEPDHLTGELAEVAAERRAAHGRFAGRVTRLVWSARGGAGEPPAWLVDALALHLSGFATQALAGDSGRAPEDVAAMSARVAEAAFAAALG